jgi:DNA-binding NarL/FixJ family response regulator
MSTCDAQAPATVISVPAREVVGLVAETARREAIAEILLGADLVPAHFDSVQQIIDLEGSTCPPAIVLWIEDPLCSMHRLIEPLTKRFPQVAVVVAGDGLQRREVRAALAAGAAGVVIYDELPDSLAPCLRAVRVGQICVPREHRGQVEPPVLSTREKQILGLVVMGYMNSQIAGQLFLAESTVKSHLSSAFGKLGVRSRNEAVDLILDPERGLGTGILGLGGEPLDTAAATV